MAKNKAFRSLFKAKITQKMQVIHRKFKFSTGAVEKHNRNPQKNGYINKKYRIAKHAESK